jgi:hypothetical protein
VRRQPGRAGSPLRHGRVRTDDRLVCQFEQFQLAWCAGREFELLDIGRRFELLEFEQFEFLELQRIEFQQLELVRQFEFQLVVEQQLELVVFDLGRELTPGAATLCKMGPPTGGPMRLPPSASFPALAGATAVLLVLHAHPGAQVPRSQHASVTQHVANTRVTIEYDRPVARGRELFGALVPWGRVWSPSSNTAAVVSFSSGLRVNGQPLPGGTYSLWAEPNPERWTIIFGRDHPVFHTRYPRGRDALRVTAVPRKGAHMETLAFYFPVADGTHAELVLHWGTVVVPLSLDVP